MRLILPLIIILLSIGSFIFFTQPILNDPLDFTNADGSVDGGIFALEEQKKVIEASLKDASELRDKVSKLTSTLDAIKDEDIERLDNFLPDSVNEVQLVTDINNIAKQSGMKIDKVNTEIKTTRVSSREVANNFNPQLSSLSVSFETEGGYSQMRAFLANISQSLRVLDIKDLSFSINPTNPGRPIYDITLTTYYLK